MAAGSPALPLGADPLIAEAKARARRRLLLALGLTVAAAAAAAGTMFATRSSGNALGICATAPSGWQERTVTIPRFGLPTVVLTNFRFGRMDDLYGLTDRFAWPANGVTVAVSNVPPGGPPVPDGHLHFRRSDFGGIEGSTQPSGQIVRSSHGRNLVALVEVGALTPATIAAANDALAGVRICSA